jgi:hypothetical protein
MMGLFGDLYCRIDLVGLTLRSRVAGDRLAL